MKKLFTFFVLLGMFSLSVNAQNSVDFYMNFNSNCAPTMVTLVDNSFITQITGNPVYNWYMNEILISTMQFPEPIEISDPGNTSIRLRILDDFDNSELGFSERNYYFSERPKDFFISTSKACPGERVHFKAPSEAFNVLWDFGKYVFLDHSTMYSTEFEYVFDKEGTYNIQLILQTQCGTDTIIKNVTVSSNAIPDVHPFAIQTQLCPNEAFNFNVAGDFQSYLWDFGDGKSSTEKSPLHTYPDQENNFYYAKVTVTNHCGGTATDSVQIEINNSLSQQVDFVSFPINGYFNACPMVEIQFETMAKGQLLWDFGDGVSSTLKSPTHRFSAAGEYYVSLTAVSGCGGRDTYGQSIIIENFEDYIDYLDFEIQGHYDETIIVCPGEVLKFRNHMYSDKDVILEWNMGDNTIKREKNPTHFYDVPGEYEVTLTAISLCGASLSYSKFVIVDGNLTPENIDLMVVPGFICPNEKAFFIDENYSALNQLSYSFDFGDGQIMNGITKPENNHIPALISHSYPNPGTYTYSVSVKNLCGNTTVLSGDIKVEENLPIKPFYYIGNSSQDNDDTPPADWSIRQSPSDHEFKVTVKWPSWQPEYGNIFHLFVWFGETSNQVEPAANNHEDGQGAPAGYVTFNSSNITQGEAVTFFVPYSPLSEPIISIAAGYYCGGQLDFNHKPDAMGSLLDDQFNTINSVPFTLFGVTDLDQLTSNGVIIDPEYDGSCNKDKPDGRWYHQIEDGVYAILDFYYDNYFQSLNYSLYYSNKLSYEGTSKSVSSGSVTGQGQNPYEFLNLNDFYYCMSEALYKYVKLSDNEIQLIPEGTDNCDARSEFLSTTFFKLEDTEIDEYAPCPGDPVQFNIVGGLSYIWDFGDGSPAKTEQYPTHAYAAAGNYTAKVIIASGCGSSDTLYTQVIVSDKNKPNLYINSYPFKPQSRDTVYFNGSYFEDMPDGFSAYTYSWNFGDGKTSSLARPKHVYDEAGEYKVSLTVSNGCGSSEFESILVVRKAYSDCSARFTYFYEGNTVSFEDQSTGDITSWQWDFGDGNSSNLYNPSHGYMREGTYTVTLTVFNDANNCVTSMKRRIVIGEPVCAADFSFIVNNNTGYAQFTSQILNAEKIYWDFGDGKYSTELNPVHTYSRFGIYTVCLTVWNGQSDCMVKVCHDISYGDPQTIGNKPDFSYFIDHATKTVSLTDLSIGTSGRWYWTMGDGGVKDGKNPVYTYSKSGTYTICLNFWDEESKRSFDVCKEIQVGELICNLQVRYTPLTDPENLTILFKNETLGDATHWFWSFGDGQTSIQKDPKITYQKPGFYLVTLSVRNDENGCTDQYSSWIQIGSSDCRAEFSFNFNNQTNIVTFRNESQGNTAYYYWDFGDGNYSTDINPTHTYTKPGLYYPSLTVANLNSLCMDKIVKTIQAGEVNCGAKFEVFVDSLTNTAFFTNRIYGDATNLLWIFGDGSYSTDNNPVHTFTAAGYYTVTLNTYNSENNCMDQYSQRIVISKLGSDSKADFTFRPDGGTGTVVFKNQSMGNIVSYLWDFGDGFTSNEESPTHTFANSGYRLVCLNVENNEGIPDMHCKWVAVDVTAAQNCRTDFIFNVEPLSKKVVFADKSKETDTWEWDFGDGSKSTVQNPQHTYTESGYYGVKLMSSNAVTGCSSVSFKMVNVNEAGDLIGGFSFEADSATKKARGYPVDFVGASSGDGARYEWDFGEEQEKKQAGVFKATYTGSNIVRYIYEFPGTYTVCMRVSNPKIGKTHISCQSVQTSYGIGVENNPSLDLNLQVFPNPFTEKTSVRFTLNEPGFVELVVMDNLGRIMETLIRNNRSEGENLVYWDAKSRPAGIYHLKLTTQKGIVVTQLVLSK
jgi:PKD repeat protein